MSNDSRLLSVDTLFHLCMQCHQAVLLLHRNYVVLGLTGMCSPLLNGCSKNDKCMSLALISLLYNHGFNELE